MKLTCNLMKRTRDRITCKELKTPCIFQYYKQCKGAYELTDGALTCGIRERAKDGQGKE